MIKLRPGEIPEPVSDNSAICLIIKSVPLVTVHAAATTGLLGYSVTRKPHRPE